MYQFVFTKEDKRKRVLEKRQWTFDNQMLVIHPWRKGLDYAPDVFCLSLMWVQAWQIPVQWLSMEIAWKLGRVFSKCYKVVIPKNGSKEGRFAKLLVEINLTKPQTWGTKLRCKGEETWIEVKYENIPLLCFYCGKVRHGDRLCGRKQEDIENSTLHEGQFGEWLRRGGEGNRRGFLKSRSWEKSEGGRMRLGKHGYADEGISTSKGGSLAGEVWSRDGCWGEGE